MITSIYSRKGGQGKTPISFGLMKCNPEYFYASNDFDGSMVYIDKLKDRSKYISNLKELREVCNKHTDIIYDAGGYVSDITYEMLKKSDLIIVPSVLGEITILSARRLITELRKDKNIKAKIILVVTKHEQSKDLDNFKNLIGRMFAKITDEVIFIRKTKFFENIIKENITFDEYVNNNQRYRKSAFFDEWREFKEVYDRYTNKGE